MINWIVKALKCRIFVCGGIAFISAFSLGAAYTAQYLFGLEPCILCLYQRIPFAITLVLGLVGLVAARVAQPVILLSAIVFLCGSGLAFYHHGVEQHWWVSHFEACAGDTAITEAADPQAALAALLETPSVRCDEIPWIDPVVGWSMAAWNAIMSFLLGLGCLLCFALGRET